MIFKARENSFFVISVNRTGKAKERIVPVSRMQSDDDELPLSENIALSKGTGAGWKTSFSVQVFTIFPG